MIDMANPYVNKFVFGGETVVDLTGDTATAADVAQGKTFHLASGEQAVGTASGGSSTGSSVFYGTCATAASTAAKVVVCEEFTADDLVEGVVLFVKFSNACTYNGTSTLNVNSTGAHDIARVGTTKTIRYYWSAGEVIAFVYDGTNWVMQGRGTASTTYYGLTRLSSATNSTSTALAATASAVKAAYDLANGKQDALVSGTNIKTINGNSILGSGDLVISGGGGGASGWTDVTSLFQSASDQSGVYSYDHVLTNGSMVVLSITGDGSDPNVTTLPLPSGYHVAGGMRVYGQVQYLYTGDDDTSLDKEFPYVEDDYLETNGYTYTFSVVYPVGTVS